jgi:hypothetical protein
MRFGSVALVVAFAALVVGTAAEAQTVQELRVRWQSTSAAVERFVPGRPEPPANVRMTQRRRAPGTISRRRGLELSADQLVISGVDASGREVYRNAMPDPRILRAESPSPTGELTGEVLYHADTEFLIEVPDDPSITEVKLYHPRWTGTAFTLDLVVAIPLP